jgi:hypothetical protein
VKCESKQVQEIKSSFLDDHEQPIELIEECKTKAKMNTIGKYLVSNKHLQLQMLLVQFFLSAVLADSNDSNAVEMAENSTQSALRNQIAGKLSETAFFIFIPTDLHNVQ